MTSTEVLWLILGVALGYLAGTAATLFTLRWRARHHHPMSYPMIVPTTGATTSTTGSDYVDWDHELAVFTEATEPPPAELPKRRLGPAPKAVADEQCPICHQMYKRVSQHIRLSHPTPAPKRRARAKAA